MKNNKLKEITKSHYDNILKKFNEYQLKECYSKNIGLKHQINYLRNKFNENGLVDYVWDDFLFCIDNLRYSIANVLLYKNLGLADIHVPYKPTNTDWLFCYFIDNSYSHLYSAWNRAANFINIFFKTIENEKNIYFHNVIDTLNNVNNIHYVKLKKFRNEDYKNIIIPYRNEIIHDQMSYYIIIKKFVENNNNPAELKGLQQERNERQLFLVKQHKFLYNSLEDIIKLIQLQFPNNSRQG